MNMNKIRTKVDRMRIDLITLDIKKLIRFVANCTMPKLNQTCFTHFFMI